jgi:SAM-dependent methyltransferase
MGAQYDEIGALFEAVKPLPVVRYGERPMLGHLLADVRGRTVLDVACGTGFYARECARLGARRVVGVDISSEMIAAARRAEEQDSLGIEYHVYDAGAMPRLGSFDLALAAWLFNYAETENELGSMLERIALNLAPHGYIVGFTSRASFEADGTDLGRYGYRLSRLGEIDGGSRWQIIVPLPDGDIAIETFMLSRACYDRAARRAGLSFEWIPLEVSQEGLQAFEPGFWDDLLRNPPMVAFRAVRLQ